MKNFFGGLLLAVRSYGKSLRLIQECKLGWVFIFPFIILILNIYLGANLSGHLANVVTDWIRDIIPFSMGDSWIAGFLRTIGAFLVWISLFFIFIYIGGYLLLILLSPVLVYVSERVDQHLTGRQFPFVFKEFISDIFRGVTIALRNLSIEIGNSILLIVVGFLPLVGFVAPIYLLGIAAYFYGFSFMDYSLERHRYTVRESVLKVRRNKGTAIGLGMVYMLFTTIPFIGFAFAGAVSIFSTVAATVAVNEMEKEGRELF